MKTFTIIWLLAGLTFVCACKKESNNSSLTGKWKLTATYRGTGSSSTDDWKPVDLKTNLYLQFNNNGSLGGNSYYRTYVSYIIKDGQIVTLYKADGVYENYSYRIENNVLTFSMAGPIVCFEGCSDRYVRVN